MDRTPRETVVAIDWSDFVASKFEPTDQRRVRATYEAVERLLTLQQQKKLTLGVSSRFRTDKKQDPDPARKARHLASLEHLIERGVQLLASTVRFDVGWGAFATDEDRALEDELVDILFPNRLTTPTQGHWLNEIADIDHLRDAVRAGYDVFLSEDKAILKRSDAIVEAGIKVRSISAFLNECAADSAKTALTQTLPDGAGNCAASEGEAH